MSHKAILVGFAFLLNSCEGNKQKASNSDNELIGGSPSEYTGYFVDDRDGQKYKTVRIGDNVWTAENLNFSANDSSWCLNDDPNNCKRYGRMYSFNSALSACPSGWHIPSREEFESLFEYYGGLENAGRVLTSDDTISLRIPLGGWRGYKGGYANFDDTMIWTATSIDNLLACGIDVSKGNVNISEDVGKRCGLYVRLIKNK